MTTTSPWSRQAQAPATPSVTVPPSLPSPVPTPPAAAAPSPGRRRRWPWAVLALLLTVVISAAVGSVVTYAMTRTNDAMPASPPGASPTTTPPHFSVAEVTAAKETLCQTFDVSVRGQEGQGGVRVAGGDVNVPIVLRAVNSAAAVQDALGPATPPDVAAAAKKYVRTTLDQTAAAMGNTPTSEVNRLTDVRNDALFALIDLCGLPR